MGPPSTQFSLGLEWLRKFEKEKGRPLRVLHIGNIANNAFLNAKFLRRIGIQADVLSHSYTHVMSYPEWEEVEITNPHGGDDAPNFAPQDLNGYERPEWFMAGSLHDCFEVTMQRARHGPSKVGGVTSSRRSEGIGLSRSGWPPSRALLRLFGPTVVAASSLLWRDPYVLAAKVVQRVNHALARGRLCPYSRLLRVHIQKLIIWLIDRSDQRKAERLKVPASSVSALAVRTVARFKELFPARADQLSLEEVASFGGMRLDFAAACSSYDVVQCYGTDPVHLLLAGKRPYVAFEHGTLRDFTMGPQPLHRLTALAYREADHVFITNGDCREYAERLGISNFTPIVHPVDVEQHRQAFGGGIEQLRHEIGAEVILFCPLRHDYLVKGTDVHLHALPLLKQRLSKTVKLVLISWGRQVQESKDALLRYSCENDVVWRGSMCRITMIKHIRAADVVLDQMALPHFGATAPQAIAAGTPVISSYDPNSTRWIISEPAPILPAFSPSQVADAIIRALDPDWRREYERRAMSWTDTYHHPNNVIRAHLSVYRRLLQNER